MIIYHEEYKKIKFPLINCKNHHKSESLKKKWGSIVKIMLTFLKN